jgi:dihydrofolate synthase/folylpolyglutamate synthase
VKEFAAFCQRLFRQNEFAFKLGTDRIAAALRVEGNPDHQYDVILVGGTNGKGSVSSLIHAGLVGAGYRTGLYTSPHLMDVRERIRVNGRLISEQRFLEIGRHCLKRWSDEVPATSKLTYFELVTVIACIAFAEMKVEKAVFEVGLGGRLDATNALRRRLSVITPVAVDHTQHLGADIPTILGEKTAILEAGRPGVVCRPSGWSASQTREFASSRGAEPLWVEGQEFEAVADSLTVDGETLPADWVPFDGKYQRENAACALAALTLSRSTFADQLPPLRELPSLLSAARWPGRFTPVSLGGRVLQVDCAHNPHAARAAAEHLRERFPRGVTALVAVGVSKDLRAVLEAIRPAVSRLIAVPLTHPRVRPAAEVARMARELHMNVVEPPSFEAALRSIAESDDPTAALGSIYLVGSIQRAAGLSPDDLVVIEDP